MFHSLPIFSHPPKQAHRRGPLRIACAERRVKPLARLLRCATALRVTAPLGCGSAYQHKPPSNKPQRELPGLAVSWRSPGAWAFGRRNHNS